MTKNKRILVAPLDWGLGHASRCIPIIKLLLQKNAEVIIAADKRPYQLLKNEFSQLEYIELAGYNISYPRAGSMILHLLKQLPKVFLAIKREHHELKNIIKEYNIDIVISDNRYGLWNKNIPCIFITHQINIQSPFGGRILHWLTMKFINKYTETWIPDSSDSFNLSGKLSHITNQIPNIYYVGPLSRLKNKCPTSQQRLDILVIISGPEPQRSIFEYSIIKELQNSKLKCMIVQGLPELKERKKITEFLEIVSYLDSDEMSETILASEIVISRPGYSTIMDLAVLGKKAIFIPTPGQTEQEYLAKKLKQEKIAFSVPQNKFSIVSALEENSNYTGFKAIRINSRIIEDRVNNLLS